MSKVTHALGVAGVFIAASHLSPGQSPAAATQATAVQLSDQQELVQRLDKMMRALDTMQNQLRDSQHQIEELRSDLRVAESRMGQISTVSPDQVATDLQSSVEQLKDDDQILQEQVKQHEQTKVETTSKYPLRVTGMLLFSTFLNNGEVNNIDLPGVALPRAEASLRGSFSATLSQTVLGLYATGPHLAGAASSADVSIDFFGGSPSAYYTTSAGLLRLRTAHASLDWVNNSLRLALDKPLMSHTEPTSLLSEGEPPLAWSGNLWIWSPQVIWNRRVNGRAGGLDLQAGLIDPAAPGPPGAGPRQPDATERSRTPGSEARVGYRLPLEGRELEIGGGSYYSRQSYSYGHHIDAWAATADWRLAFTKQLELSGALYRGRAIGGLGGAFQDYLENTHTYTYRGLNAEGGWSQLKWRIARSIETNAAIGQASSFSGDLRFGSPPGTTTYTSLARNRTVFGNAIYRPRSYIAFSVEYRNIRSWPLTGTANASQSIGLGAGYLF